MIWIFFVWFVSFLDLIDEVKATIRKDSSEGYQKLTEFLENEYAILRKTFSDVIQTHKELNRKNETEKSEIE